MKNRFQIGKESEDRACAYLASNGYSIIQRNCRRRFGEIDLICSSKTSLVAVEVKTISENWEEWDICRMVNPLKLCKIRRVLSSFIANEGSLNYDDVRFDVIAVHRSGGIRHYQGVR